MNKFIKTILVFTFILLAGFVKAQDIQITLADINTLLINGISVNELNEEKIEKLLGEPSKIEESGNDKDYFYEDFGVTISLQNQEIKALGINYNWDGDKKIPQTSFTGNLVFGGEKISINTERETFSNSKIIAMSCIAEIICTSTNKESKIRIIAGFKDNKITQIIFLF